MGSLLGHGILRSILVEAREFSHCVGGFLACCRFSCGSEDHLKINLYIIHVNVLVRDLSYQGRLGGC